MLRLGQCFILIDDWPDIVAAEEIFDIAKHSIKKKKKMESIRNMFLDLIAFITTDKREMYQSRN